MRLMLPRHLNLINSLIVQSHILAAPGNTHTFAIYVRVNVRVRRRYGAATRVFHAVETRTGQRARARARITRLRYRIHATYRSFTLLTVASTCYIHVYRNSDCSTRGLTPMMDYIRAQQTCSRLINPSIRFNDESSVATLVEERNGYPRSGYANWRGPEQSFARKITLGRQVWYGRAEARTFFAKDRDCNGLAERLNIRQTHAAQTLGDVSF